MYRFGPGQAASFALIGLSVTHVVFAFPRLSHAGIADARADARAGVDLDALHASPGAVGPGHLRLQLARARPFSGSEMLENAIRVDVPHRHGAFAFAFEQRSSPVHRDDAFVVVVQMRRSAVRAGVGARIRRLAFENYEARWRHEIRFGTSLRLGASAFTARFVPRPLDEQPPRLDCGARLMWHRTTVFHLQYVREPGFPGRLRGAVSLRATALSLHTGYDVATEVVSAGIEAGRAHLRFVYAVQNHPDLRWSHTWMLEFGPR